MFDQIYGWIQNVSVYLIMTAAVMHAIPGKDYGRYIRFFSGLVLILLMFTPLLRAAGMERRFSELYSGVEYEMERQEIEKAYEIYENSGLDDLLTEPGYSGSDETGNVPEDESGWPGTADETGQQENADGAGEKEGSRIEVGEIEIGK